MLTASQPLHCILLALLLAALLSHAAAAISLSHIDGAACTDTVHGRRQQCAAGTHITIHGSGFSSLTATSASESASTPAAADYYNTTIDNASPRRDTNGDILDVHDGNILYHRGVYYYYGAQYGGCTEINSTSGCTGAVWGESCGWQLNHNVSLYTSRDLQHWQRHDHVFETARDLDVPAMMVGPKIIFCNATQLFVLWFNYGPQNSPGLYGTATSPSPYGPFKVRVAPVTTLVNAGPSDSALWADESTGQGYLIYSGAFMVSVEAMTEDYLQTLGAANSSGQVGAYSVEAPAFYYRNGRYHVSDGHLCCYCQEGAMATVYTADHPLGPYTFEADLSAGIPAQETDIMRFFDGDGVEQFMYRGDRWQQSPDNTKAHDPTAMALLTFNASDIVQPLQWLPSFNITVRALPWSSEWRVVLAAGVGLECGGAEVLDDARLSCWLPADVAVAGEAELWLLVEDGAGRAMSTAVEVGIASAGEKPRSHERTVGD